MDLSSLLDPNLAAIVLPVLGGTAWVGRVHQRVVRNDADIKAFTEGLTAHIAADAIAHQRIANIEGTLSLALDILKKIDARE